MQEADQPPKAWVRKAGIGARRKPCPDKSPMFGQMLLLPENEVRQIQASTSSPLRMKNSNCHSSHPPFMQLFWKDREDIPLPYPGRTETKLTSKWHLEMFGKGCPSAKLSSPTPKYSVFWSETGQILSQAIKYINTALKTMKTLTILPGYWVLYSRCG